MVIFKEYPHILDKISQFKVNNDTNIVLKGRSIHKQPIEIVIKRSETREGQFLLAVFMQVGKIWICQESGYHSDMQIIEDYLLKKYFKQHEDD